MDYAYNQLQELIEYDREHNTAWLETLGVYLRTDGSVKKTAEELYFHPNTISYRINRISDILGCNLNDFETKVNLSISYKIYRYIYDSKRI